MSLKEVVKERIPDRIKALPDFRLFLVWVGECDAKTLPQLKKELDSSIDYYEDWLRDNQKSSRLGTKNRFLTSTAKYIDFLKAIRKNFARYL